MLIISLSFCKFIIRRDGINWKCSSAVMSLIYPGVNLCKSGLAGVICEKCVLACKPVRLLFNSLIAGIVFSLFNNYLLRISK